MGIASMGISSARQTGAVAGDITMAIREDIVASAVTFLQDPSVAGSPIENRIAFLQSKNLTQEEIDTALARAGGESAPANYSNYAPQQQQVIRQPQPGYGAYQQPPWHQPPPEIPKRDWRGRLRFILRCKALCLSYDCAAYPTTTRTRQA